MSVSARRIVWIVIAFMFFVLLLPAASHAASSVHDRGSFNEINLSVNAEQKFHGGTYDTSAIFTFFKIAEDK